MEEKWLSSLRISRCQNVGPKLFFKLMDQFDGDNERILYHLEKTKKYIVPSIDCIRKELELVNKKGGEILSYRHEFYPKELRNIADFPPFITVLGKKEIFQKVSIGIVGARNASFQGRDFIEKLAWNLSARGFSIVSGMARGIDSAAHKGSIKNGTVAVLAGGIDCVYPSENVKLYQEIQENGAVISEMPYGQLPIACLFARRNRIIAGISKWLVLCEASLSSGSMITAKYALEQGKDIFAVPGHPSDYRSHGGNKLIQEGANLLQSVDDILSMDEFFIRDNGNTLEESALKKVDLKQFKHLPFNAKEVIDLLSHNPISIDEMIYSLNGKVLMSELMPLLIELEISGKIMIHSNQKVSLV